MLKMELIFNILLLCLFTFVLSKDVVPWNSVFLNGRVKRGAVRSTIKEDLKCVEVERLCTDVREHDDMLILECLYSLDPSALSRLNKECQDVVWHHTSMLIENNNVKDALSQVCRNDLSKLNCQSEGPPGSYLKCIVSNKDDITHPECTALVERFENVAFYDYQWITSFLQNCKGDISRLQCGRIDNNGLSQSETLACLQDHIADVPDLCRKEVFRLAEIQADNIKFDHQLYLACSEDYMRYCRQFVPGSGRIFRCLMQHRNDQLTSQCHNHLMRRQKLISQDYKVSRGLMRSCRDDIKKSHCRKQTSEDRGIRLAQVLLCLENVIRNGTKVDPDCEVEMVEHRKIMMEDYRLSPEIVDGCSLEISKFCSGLEVGGKTIHCLMDHARLKNKNKRIGDSCQRALEDLVKETDVGEDWRVDPVLHEACNPVVKAACRDIRGGNARVMSCLMDNIGADHMTEDCEDALMQIQYFVARDFKLDPQLYRACREDATRLCHASRDWEDNKVNYDPNNAPLVLPCLYRYLYHPDKDKQLKPVCIDEIRRVMRQRAVNVDLQPEIEEVCLDDLSLFCFDKTAKGEEMQCLQKNLEDLKEKCKEAIINFTEIEAQYIGLNPFIMTHCRKAIETHCATEVKNDDGDIMECLIAHKNDPDVKKYSKCRVSIEHFQIVSLKDYHFSYKFKIACKNYAMRYCREAKTKAAVVMCLSEKVRNDTVNGLKSDIQKECRQQLKAQLFQQRENIDYDPKLKEACAVDIKLHCKDVEHGTAQVLECLQTTSSKLSEACQKEIFKVKKQEIADNSIDYALITMCADSIQQFCPHAEQEHVLDCLKKHKDELTFNKKCRLVVIHRMIEQHSDYRLNPSLQENCKPDIKKFCYDKILQSKPDQELNGEVIKCLKVSFKQSRLSNKCEKEMASILRDQALDVRLNPLLKAVCKNELETICREDSDEDAGDIEECLKNALLNHKIPSPACQVEVASMIEESQADIQVDPLLQRTCALDLLKFCDGVPQGGGRHIKCLKIVMDDKNKQLVPECKTMLTKRLEMYRNAAEVVPPADLQELYTQVVASPAKHYFFMVVMMALGSFFVIGMFCGRASRRHILSKNK